MPTEPDSTSPKLDKPGAGLPWFEWAVAKYIMVPRRLRSASVDQGLREFDAETSLILQAIEPLSEADLTERRLIPRLPGLEDSSRYWSVAMTLEHLIIVGTRMKAVIQTLSTGVSPNARPSTADVKPPVDTDASTIVNRFRAFADDFVKSVGAADTDKFPSVKQAHPWFGPLNAREWALFAAPHQQIHRKQIEGIIKRLH